MAIFTNNPYLEESYSKEKRKRDLLIEKLISLGERKTKEPVHRTKKLRSWPSEFVKRKILTETLEQEKGSLSSKKTLEKWKSDRADLLWEEFSKEIEEEEKIRIITEFGISHISHLITNTIYLERMYTTLKPIGQKQWEFASDKLKTLTEEEKLISITENPELFHNKGTKKTIPDWIKGTILYLSFQGSKCGKDMLDPHTKETPDMSALRTATNWCLGNHLDKNGLEETAKIFEDWHKEREKTHLEIVQVGKKDPPALIIEPPTLHGKEIPWALGWKIIPITEKEIRELAEKILKEENHFLAVKNLFKKKLFDRWISSITRRAYLEKIKETQDIEERWETATRIIKPIDNYVSEKITAEHEELKLIAKTEAAWIILTSKLPEPEYI